MEIFSPAEKFAAVGSVKKQRRIYCDNFLSAVHVDDVPNSL